MYIAMYVRVGRENQSALDNPVILAVVLKAIKRLIATPIFEIKQYPSWQLKS